jgi:DnaJ-domain-containing protein 1
LSNGGIGVSTAFPLAVGETVTVNGRLDERDRRRKLSREARICWCLEKDDGSYRAGLAFDDAEDDAEDTWQSCLADTADESEDDHYEILQLSPGAHPDTIHRVYRLLAQRYHPDNARTGNEELFKKVLAAYETLRDPAKRAAFDTRHAVIQRKRWRLFESAADARSREAEQRKRQSLLSLLYARRIQEPERPVLTIHDLEDLLGCPRDHLEVTLWYLREKRLIHRDDRGRYEITVEGVDALDEETPAPPQRQMLPPAPEVRAV